MRVIGVVDLAAGRAVHARGGVRDHYLPVAACGGIAINGDAIALATAYRDALGIREVYVADLDAIAGSAPQAAIVAAITHLGLPVWLDAGISTWERAQEAINRGAARVVVGLETLSSFEALDVICISIGGERVAFSLDLRAGEPVRGSGRLKPAPTSVDVTARTMWGPPSGGPTHRQVWGPPSGGPASACAIASRAVEAGVGAMIVLDLARVGTACGVDIDTIRAVGAAAPGVMLVAGGGVRGPEDLQALRDAGCDGALVATMFQSVRR